jgi:hypothetical protein
MPHITNSQRFHQIWWASGVSILKMIQFYVLEVKIYEEFLFRN